jgi:hypothetical protein
MAASGGHIGVLAALVRGLAKQYGQAVEGQQQQQQQQQRQAALVEHLAAACVPLAWDGSGYRVNYFSVLLELVLDVLGPGVAEQVCQAVQQQLQRQLDRSGQHASTHHSLLQSRRSQFLQVSRLAEALVVGWAAAEKRLHAARQPVVARLQRLVGSTGQLQEQRDAHAKLSYGHNKLWDAVEGAALAAALGQEQRSFHQLGVFRVMYLQNVDRLNAQLGGCPATADRAQRIPPCVTVHGCNIACSCCDTTPTNEDYELHCLVRDGLDQAARNHPKEVLGAPAGKQHPVPTTPGRYPSFWAPGVNATFLAAWVDARRRLQQLPQEVVAAVTAAVKVAQQQVQEQQQQGGEVQGTHVGPDASSVSAVAPMQVRCYGYAIAQRMHATNVAAAGM